MFRRRYYRPYWYTAPSGWVFLAFFIAAIWTGCNMVRHRTPAEQAALESEQENWTYKTCKDMTTGANIQGWKVNQKTVFLPDFKQSYAYAGQKGDVTLTYTCADAPSAPPENVCFKWTGQNECASLPPRH